MNAVFFEKLEQALAGERLDAYRQDGAVPVVVMARYLWNMALCESLYCPLQISEIALRNAIHAYMTASENNVAWYDSAAGLMSWQREQVEAARKKIRDCGKEVTPGQMVSALHFGFWTCFMNKHHARTGIGYALASRAFSHAPRRERDMRKLDLRLSSVRGLRNRVFHHERIIHWKDLDAQHADILRLIGWISPELRELALALDRYVGIRQAGLDPWVERLRVHWPE